MPDYVSAQFLCIIEKKNTISSPLKYGHSWVVLGINGNFMFDDWRSLCDQWSIIIALREGLKIFMRIYFYKLSVLCYNSHYILLSNIRGHELLKYYVKLCNLFWKKGKFVFCRLKSIQILLSKWMQFAHIINCKL